MNNFQYKVIYSTTKKVIDMTYVYYKSTFSDKKLAILTTDGSIIFVDLNQKENEIEHKLPGIPTCFAYCYISDRIAVGCENTVYLYEHFDFSNPVHTYPCTSFVKACHFILNYLLFCTSTSTYITFVSNTSTCSSIPCKGYAIFSCTLKSREIERFPSASFAVSIPHCSNHGIIYTFTFTILDNQKYALGPISVLNQHKDMIYMCKPAFELRGTSLLYECPTLYMADENTNQIVIYAEDKKNKGHYCYSMLSRIKEKNIKSIHTFQHNNVYYMSLISDEKVLILSFQS